MHTTLKHFLSYFTLPLRTYFPCLIAFSCFTYDTLCQSTSFSNLNIHHKFLLVHFAFACPSEHCWIFATTSIFFMHFVTLDKELDCTYLTQTLKTLLAKQLLYFFAEQLHSQLFILKKKLIQFRYMCVYPSLYSSISIIIPSLYLFVSPQLFLFRVLF